jgi:hypothetical protein
VGTRRTAGHRAVSYVIDRCEISSTQNEVRWLVGEIEKLKPSFDGRNFGLSTASVREKSR